MAGFIPFCQSKDLSLSVLLVSKSASHLKSISEELQKENSSNGNLFKVFACESISQILKATEIPQVDYVVFCVNLSYFEALNQIESSILKLDRSFLLDRICLICDNTVTPGSMMPKLLHLKHKYQLHILWGDMANEIPNLSRRLVNLISAVCGVTSGFPIITQRSWHMRSRENFGFSSAASEDELTF